MDKKIQDYKMVYEKIINSIREVCKDKSVVIGLSGGIDSSITCALAIDALGSKRVKAIIVTNSRYSIESLKKAREYAIARGINTQEIDTENARKYLSESLKMETSGIIATSTLDARICDLIIKTVASLEDRVYLGTINGTERLTGWYPKGNLVGDYCPIGGLLKGQIKKLASYMGIGYLNETVAKDARRICSGCGDLEEFSGITYDELDKILYIYETTVGKDIEEKLAISNTDKEKYDRVFRRIVQIRHKLDVFPKYCKINY